MVRVTHLVVERGVTVECGGVWDGESDLLSTPVHHVVARNHNITLRWGIPLLDRPVGSWHVQLVHWM